jgi:hypothetical protein
MLKLWHVLPSVIIAATVASCVQWTIIDDIPATRSMTVEDAEKLMDARMGVIGWNKRPNGTEQLEGNGHCGFGGSKVGPIRFINLSTKKFYTTSVVGEAHFEFRQPGRKCATVLYVKDITFEVAKDISSALVTLANAERSGARLVSADPDRDQWTKIAASDDPADFQSFLMSFPSSPLADQALRQLITTRQNMAIARGKTSRAPVSVPLQAPATGLVLESGPNEGTDGGYPMTSTTRVRIVRGDLSSFIEEVTTSWDVKRGANSTKMTSTMTYGGRHSLFARTGRIKESRRTFMVDSGAPDRTEIGSGETYQDNLQGDIGSLFPMKVGNNLAVKYTTRSSLTATTTFFLASIGPYTTKTATDTEENCIVEDYKPIKMAGQSLDAFKIFCVNKNVVNVDGIKSVTMSFSDNFYSTKLHYIVRTVATSTSDPIVRETNYTVVSGGG